MAIGSHEPDARETDDALARARDRRRRVARVGAARGGRRDRRDRRRRARAQSELVTLAELVRGGATVPADRPRLFKSTGMAWEDAVVAGALLYVPAQRLGLVAHPQHRAGTPATTALAGTSLVTTASVPMIALSPTVTPRRMHAP